MCKLYKHNGRDKNIVCDGNIIRMYFDGKDTYYRASEKMYETDIEIGEYPEGW